MDRVMRIYAGDVFYQVTIHQHKPGLPYLLMLHGFMGSGQVFKPLIPGLSGFCNPITIDLLGHGKTVCKPVIDRFTVEVQVRDLQSVLTRLAFDNLYLYGYSMGGRLAFQMITVHPELFRGAVIESAHCGIISGKERIERKQTDEDRATQIEQNFEDFLSDWMTLPLFRHTPEDHKSIYMKVMEKQNPELMAASLRGFGAGVMPEVCSKLDNVSLPVHLVSGELDAKYVEILSKIAELNPEFYHTIIPGAGHRVHTDRPEELVKVVGEAIESSCA